MREYDLDFSVENPFESGREKTISLPDYGIPLTLVQCSPGKFQMGSPKTELGHSLNEILHEEVITEGFWIGKFPVTQKQYECITGDNPSRDCRTLLMCGEDVPVDSVTHADAEWFCHRLSEVFPLSAWKFDLPTSAQWEYACRAGCESPLYNGTKLAFKYGHCLTLSEIAWHCFDKVTSPQPVGRKKPNAWGIFDMLGNIHEWCHEKYEHVADKKHSRSREKYIARGGSYQSYPKYCRSACVIGKTDDSCLNRIFLHDVGFRIVLRKRSIPRILPYSNTACLRCEKSVLCGKVFCSGCAEASKKFSPWRLFEAMETGDFPLLRHRIEDRSESPLWEYQRSEKTNGSKPVKR